MAKPPNHPDISQFVTHEQLAAALNEIADELSALTEAIAQLRGTPVRRP